MNAGKLKRGFWAGGFRASEQVFCFIILAVRQY